MNRWPATTVSTHHPVTAGRARWPGALLAGWIAAWAAAPAAAQDSAPVYRCGNSYQAKPCAGGQAVDAADPRSADQVQQAREAAKREAALARQMAAERRADERQAARQGPANVGPAPAPAPQVAARPAKPPHKKRVKASRLPKPPKAG